MNAITANLENGIKVPVVITLFFWLIKILATTVGETGADYLIFNLDFGLPLTSAIMSLVLAAFLYAQLRSSRYIPWLYWLVVVLVSIVGTLITDTMTDIMNIPLTLSTVGFSLALITTFRVWYQREGSLSIHSISSLRRETFYWLSILFTFALGTAAGDLLAESVGLGYGVSALIFASAIAVIATGYYAFNWNSILAFWLTYIITRPLGASLGDLLSQPVADGGLGFGTVLTSGLFLALILALVVFLSISRMDSPRALTAADNARQTA